MKLRRQHGTWYVTYGATTREFDNAHDAWQFIKECWLAW